MAVAALANASDKDSFGDTVSFHATSDHRGIIQVIMGLCCDHTCPKSRLGS